ncbi:MAG: ABC transporter permease [Chloroflexota bacterium]
MKESRLLQARQLRKTGSNNHVGARNGAPVALLLLVLAVAILWVPNFATTGNIRNVLVQSVPLLLTTVGQTLVIITAGIDLSVGEVVTLSAILASGLMQPGYPGAPAAVAACLLAGVLVGGANAFMIGRLNLPPFLATLATMFCLQGVNLYLRPVPGGFVPPEFRAIVTAQVGMVPVAPVIALLLLGVLALHFSRSRFGLQAYAVGGDEGRARLSGVSTSRVKLAVYAASGVLASIAGLFLAARTGTGDPNIGSTYVFDSITATVLGGASLLGGRGSLWGALASALVLAILANVLNLLGVVTYWQWIIRGVILVLAVAGYSVLELRERGAANVFDALSKRFKRQAGQSAS